MFVDQPLSTARAQIDAIAQAGTQLAVVQTPSDLEMHGCNNG